jgi:hypothetical protein
MLGWGVHGGWETYGDIENYDKTTIDGLWDFL